MLIELVVLMMLQSKATPAARDWEPGTCSATSLWMHHAKGYTIHKQR